MSTLSDLKGLQAAYDLKEALTQTDDRLFGSQKGEGGGGGGGGGMLSDPRMLPIVTPNGRNFLRDSAKGMRPLINRDEIKPGNILTYTSETGESQYAQVSSIGAVGIDQDGVTVKEIDAETAANYLKNHPDSQQVTLTRENLRRELVYKESPRGFWDKVFAPLDWLAVKTHNSPLARLFNSFSSKRNKEVFIVIAVVGVLAYMALAFYLVVR